MFLYCDVNAQYIPKLSSNTFVFLRTNAPEVCEFLPGSDFELELPASCPYA